MLDPMFSFDPMADPLGDPMDDENNDAWNWTQSLNPHSNLTQNVNRLVGDWVQQSDLPDWFKAMNPNDNLLNNVVRAGMSFAEDQGIDLGVLGELNPGSDLFENLMRAGRYFAEEDVMSNLSGNLFADLSADVPFSSTTLDSGTPPPEGSNFDLSLFDTSPSIQQPQFTTAEDFNVEAAEMPESIDMAVDQMVASMNAGLSDTETLGAEAVGSSDADLAMGAATGSTESLAAADVIGAEGAADLAAGAAEAGGMEEALLLLAL